MKLFHYILSLSFTVSLLNTAFCIDTMKGTTVILTCDVIKQLDGKSYGFSGARIGGMIHIQMQLFNMLYGKRPKEGTVRVGLFEFQGKLCTIIDLMKIEAETTTNDTQKKEELTAVLSKAKSMYVNTVKPFVDQSYGVKAQTTLMIDEWITKTGRQDSPLQDWAQTEEGKEFDLFNEDVSSFSRLVAHCTDLIHFFDSLIKSCPEGMKQFEKLKENYNTHHRP